MYPVAPFVVALNIHITPGVKQVTSYTIMNLSVLVGTDDQRCSTVVVLHRVDQVDVRVD